MKAFKIGAVLGALALSAMMTSAAMAEGNKECTKAAVKAGALSVATGTAAAGCALSPEPATKAAACAATAYGIKKTREAYIEVGTKCGNSGGGTPSAPAY